MHDAVQHRGVARRAAEWVTRRVALELGRQHVTGGEEPRVAYAVLARVHRVRRDRAGELAINEHEDVEAEWPTHSVIARESPCNERVPAAQIARKQGPAVVAERLIRDGFGGPALAEAARVGAGVHGCGLRQVHTRLIP